MALNLDVSQRHHARNCRSMIRNLLVLVTTLLLPSICVVVDGFQSMQSVPRIPLSEFSYDLYRDEPLIIETGLPVESLCDRLMNEISNSPITLQQRRNDHHGAATKLYTTTVDQAIDLIMLQSNHNQSFFAFCEGLLDDVQDSIQYSGKEELLDKDGSSSSRRLLDWFDSFPTEYQPCDCVVLAGEGATSTLHRDPFEWTGTSLCLEGTKLWRFLSPYSRDMGVDDGNTLQQLTEIDELVDSYRLPSVAWDYGSNVCLSAGWQSDYSLYSKRDASIPSARCLSEMEDGQRLRTLEAIALEPNSLLPSFDTDDCSCWTVIQKPGDLLLIPAHWWHQTYALEPSLAVASQRCDSTIDAARVIRHILTTTDTLENAPDLLLKEQFSANVNDVEHVIDELFGYLNGCLKEKEEKHTESTRDSSK